MNRKSFQIDWVIPKEYSGMLLREYLRVEKNISKSALTDIKFHGGTICVNGMETNVRYKLKEGDKVSILFPPEEISESMEPQKVDFNILFEDQHFLIVDKPAGIPTIPSRYHSNGSLAQGILYYYKSSGITATFHAVNRLDRDTSGIVVIAKHRYAHYLLSLQQQNKTLNRVYLAICHGNLEEPSGIIKKPIGRKEGSIIERIVIDTGQYAETHYEVVAEGDKHTLLSLQLKTGRTHQIRVHMSSIGHPLLGDDLYGGAKDLIERHALHSWKVNFFHPFIEKQCSVAAPIPSDMQKVINEL